MSRHRHDHRTRRRARGQQGFTLIELLIVVALTGIIAVPVTTWAVTTLRSQGTAQDSLRNSVATGALARTFSRDVASAVQVVAHPGGGDCAGGGAGAGGEVVLTVVPSSSATRVVYAQADATGPSSKQSLWRRVCDESGTIVSGNEIFQQIVPGSLRMACLVGGADGTDGDCDAPDSRHVQLSFSPCPLRPSSTDTCGPVTGPQSGDVRLQATRRVTPGFEGFAGGGPIAQIATSPRIGYLDTDFTFDAGASRVPDGATYRWEFPTLGGETATTQQVTRRFPSVGPHEVRLVVGDGAEATNVAVATVLVINHHPIAVATATEVGEAWVFDGSGSSHPDGLTLTYHWSFGDGLEATGVTVTDPFGPGAEGRRRAVLRVTDSVGNSSTDTVVVDLGVHPSGPILITPTPVATEGRSSRVGSVGPGLDPLQVTFAVADTFERTWQLTRVGQPEPVATAAGSSFTHTFRDGDAGEYQIVRMAPGDVVVGEPVLFRVNAAPQAGFAFTVNVRGEPTTFRADPADGSVDPEGPIGSWLWDFGWPGWTGTGATPSHSYPNPGAYQVRLVVTDSDGVTAESIQTVQIPGTPGPPPSPTWSGGSVTWGPVPGAQEYRVEFWCGGGEAPVVQTIATAAALSAQPPAGYCQAGGVSANLRVSANGQWSLPSPQVAR